MPDSLTVDEINDLVVSTREGDAAKMRYTQIAQRLPEYEMVERFMDRDRIQMQGGASIRFNVLYDHNNSAQMVGFYQRIEPTVVDVLTSFNVPWRHANFNWSWDRKEEAINQGPAAVVDLLNARRVSAFISWAEKIEDQGWNKPATSSNETDVWGIPTWVVKASSTTGGFNGGNPSGFTSGVGLDSTVITRWKNYCAQYNTIDRDDLLAKMATGFRQTRFKSPTNEQAYTRGVNENFHIYTNETGIGQYEKFCYSQNDNMGADTQKFFGMTAFKKIPVRHAFKLDADTTNPFYCLDMNYFAFVFQRGRFMFEHKPMNDVETPDTYTTHTMMTLNMACWDRRRQQVYSLAS